MPADHSELDLKLADLEIFVTQLREAKRLFTQLEDFRQRRSAYEASLLRQLRAAVALCQGLAAENAHLRLLWSQSGISSE